MDSIINTTKFLRIIITGGSSGIGRVITLEMARSKHTIFLAGRDKEKLEAIANEIKNLGSEVFFGIGDVRFVGFNGKEGDRTKMSPTKDVAKVARLIIDQAETSIIDHILLIPGVY